METVELKPEEEVCFNYFKSDEKIKVELLSGQAEFLGTELSTNKAYVFTRDVKGSIFTYNGCKLSIEGDKNSYNVTKNTSMNTYKSINKNLDLLRKNANFEKKRGPIVLICGPNRAGKTGIVKTFLNYAFNNGSKPIYVDLNCGQNLIGIPGSIGYFIKDKPSNIELFQDETNSFNLHYGFKSSDYKPDLYLGLVEKLSNNVLKKLDEDPIVRKSGIIIKANGFIFKSGFKCLLYTIDKFKVDIVLVVDNQKLNEKIESHLKYSEILSIPKFTGISIKNISSRKKNRDNRLFKYFYQIKQDSDKQQVFTYFHKIPIDKIKIFKIMRKTKKLGQNQPISPKFKINLYEPKIIKLLPIHLNHLLVVTSTSDLQKIYESNMKDFICIKNINLEKNQLTVISPQKQKLDLNCIFIYQI